jgi:hypothetical protein
MELYSSNNDYKLYFGNMIDLLDEYKQYFERKVGGMGEYKVNDGRKTPIDNPFQGGETLRKNIHPTL